MSGRGGKKAWGICDKTGFRYKLADLVYEIRDGRRTGMRVGKDVVDPDHPQNFIGRVRADDNQSLHDPRPDINRDDANAIWGWNPVGNTAQYLTATPGRVTVSIS